MAIVAGFKGELTYTKGGTDGQVTVSDASIFAWRLYLLRRMVNVTQRHQSARAYHYDQGESVVEFRAYIDQTINPGEFNGTEEATIKLYPDGSETTKFWTVTGWLEEMRVEVAIGMPNMITGKIRGTGGVTIEPDSWT